MKKKLQFLIMLLVVLGFTVFFTQNAEAATTGKGTYYVNYTFLNVRSGPGAQYELIGKLIKGNKVVVASIADGWAQTTYDGEDAWVSAQYLSKKKTVSDGWHGNVYYKDGKILSSSWCCHKAWKKIRKKANETGYYIVVDKTYTSFYLFKYNGKSWQPFKSWFCSIGKDSTPTPSGNFHILYRFTPLQSEGSTEYYAVSFKGNYCIHSTLFYPNTRKNYDSRIGAKISNGCIRLAIKNAKYIYKYVPDGTPVMIY